MIKNNKYMKKIIRVRQIELRQVNDTIEFVKWSKNPYYTKKDEYLKDGWEEQEDFLVKDNSSIQKDMFDMEEFCYTVAWLRKDREGFFVEECGNRLLELKTKHKKDFFSVYKLFLELKRE